jgi:pantothenate kinase
MSEDLGAIVEAIFARAEGRARFLVAIAGPPGAGKSTLADALREAIVAGGETAEVLPMDGFHMDDGVLSQMGRLAAKGAPDTFDVRGFLDIVRAIRRADEDVLVPVFDRSREIAIAAARLIPARTRFVIAEGNYLLLAQEPWAALDGQFDFSVMINPPVAVLDERLMRRWLSYGLDEDAARAKTSGNDLKNGEQVRDHSRKADWVLPS